MVLERRWGQASRALSSKEDKDFGITILSKVNGLGELTKDISNPLSLNSAYSGESAITPLAGHICALMALIRQQSSVAVAASQPYVIFHFPPFRVLNRDVFDHRSMFPFRLELNVLWGKILR